MNSLASNLWPLPAEQHEAIYRDMYRAWRIACKSTMPHTLVLEHALCMEGILNGHRIPAWRRMDIEKGVDAELSAMQPAPH